MERGGWSPGLYSIGLWEDVCLAVVYLNQEPHPSSLCLLNTPHHPPGSGASPAPYPHTLTDAFVHVGVAGIKVSRWAGRQADAHLADVVPLQQNEELGRALEATVDF